VSQHPDVVQAAVYGVPDDQAGDQVMAGLVLRDGVELDRVGFAKFIDAQSDIGPKWRPRYVRVMLNPPTTGTNKIIKRALVHQKWRSDLVGGDPVFVRGRDDAEYRPLDAAEESALHASFVHYQRERFWDL
jgi:fatty-acyl-CoA synthase